MTFRWPEALRSDDDAVALGYLRTYYGDPAFGPGAYDGALFDNWDSLGTRRADMDRFSADDVVAVTFLSVEISAGAVRALLRDRVAGFSSLLEQVGPDRDLVDEPEEHPKDWAGWRLMGELRSLPEVGPTTASKLLARKRPRLRPIWDSVVSEITGTVRTQWEPLRVALRADDRALQRRLVHLHEVASLPEHVSALRVLDVIAWMEGKGQGIGRRAG